MPTTPITLTLAPLVEEDYEFSVARVPDNELVPCLLWEFLRESKTARQLAQDWCAWYDRVKRGEQDNQAEIWQRLQRLTLNLNHKLNVPEFLFRAAMAWGRGRANTPWQKLPDQTKQWLAEPCELVNEPVFIGSVMHAELLAEQVTKKMDKEINKLRDGDTLPFTPARAPLGGFFPHAPGCEALCLVLDWYRYNDVAFMEGWEKLGREILKTRPKGPIPQRRKGQGAEASTDWRSKLNNLGLARLSCKEDSISRLRNRDQEAYNFIENQLHKDMRHPRGVEDRVYDARKNFAKNFYEILPFEKSKPLCLDGPRFKGNYLRRQYQSKPSSQK